ncbi:hypothetical protein MTsPCn9_13360 [Croceitalea sp. MTPC9]|uniref:hypothetical protein n=1 Tax=unclassified Croceitalea TaxID=2632280 RepID=UPI002B3C0BCA|nr:hypothetical protein MTsPCn6_15770 [Croceitalea sp. MTPC6]GMN16400.1 hypothetical protein MTsPCn9_13360 [Croceitalea sp. MTPC9]
MKNYLKTLALATLVIFAACSKDETSGTNDQSIEDLENTPLQANDVADNVVIQGGTKNDGTPPTPNELISLDVSSSSTIALLGEGFNVSINSDASVTGAYLQFKSDDGTVSDSYYDIDLNANSTTAKSIRKLFGPKKSKTSLTSKEDETTLDVDFNANIEPGTFCYVICVYDAEGNISAPQEVCVTVEAWGGNSEVVGKWNFVKEEETYSGETSVSVVGEESCSEPFEFFCDNQNMLQLSYACYTTGDAFIRFNEEGSFEFESNDSSKVLDQEASASECAGIYDEFEDNSVGSGQWAYNSDTQKFILVIYQVEYTYNGETETYTYEPGEAEAFVETDGLRVEGNFLVYSEEFEEEEYSYKVYYEKE